MKNLFVFYLKNHVTLHYLLLCLIAVPLSIGVGKLVNINFLLILTLDFILIYPLNFFLLEKSGVNLEVNRFKRDYKIK